MNLEKYHNRVKNIPADVRAEVKFNMDVLERRQANELRIGNWLMGANGEPLQIDAYGILNISQYETNVKPILLTPEILEKAGFVAVDERIFSNGKFNLYGKAPYKWSLDNTTILGQLHYLHQLQNLYFAISEEELNIQL